MCSQGAEASVHAPCRTACQRAAAGACCSAPASQGPCPRCDAAPWLGSQQLRRFHGCHPALCPPQQPAAVQVCAVLELPFLAASPVRRRSPGSGPSLPERLCAWVPRLGGLCLPLWRRCSSLLLVTGEQPCCYRSALLPVHKRYNQYCRDTLSEGPLSGTGHAVQGLCSLAF